MNMTISRKLGALIGVSVLVSVVAMSLQLYALHQTIWKDRQSLIVSQVDSAITMLAGFQARVEAGELSLEEAQNRAREAARPIRFGNNDYLFMMSADGMRVMHPDPKLQGTDAFTSKDSRVAASQPTTVHGSKGRTTSPPSSPMLNCSVPGIGLSLRVFTSMTCRSSLWPKSTRRFSGAASSCWFSSPAPFRSPVRSHGRSSA